MSKYPPGIPDTLIEIRADAPEADELEQVAREIYSLYPPQSSKPNFQLTDVVGRNGKKFVRLSTMAGSLHLMLRRGVKFKCFPRALLSVRDKNLPDYEYVA
jgi:hypothetical protein